MYVPILFLCKLTHKFLIKQKISNKVVSFIGNIRLYYQNITYKIASGHNTIVKILSELVISKSSPNSSKSLLLLNRYSKIADIVTPINKYHNTKSIIITTITLAQAKLVKYSKGHSMGRSNRNHSMASLQHPHILQ